MLGQNNTYGKTDMLHNPMTLTVKVMLLNFAKISVNLQLMDRFD